jgi:hypothetical protein
MAPSYAVLADVNTNPRTIVTRVTQGRGEGEYSPFSLHPTEPCQGDRQILSRRSSAFLRLPGASLPGNGNVEKCLGERKCQITIWNHHPHGNRPAVRKKRDAL